MSRQTLMWFLAMAMLTLLVTFSAPAFPNDMEQTETPAQKAAEAQNKPADTAVETILREQEQLLRGQGFSYDPAGRRDPFRSLFEASEVKPGKRPAGAAGMLVSEITLTGIIRDARDGDMAMVRGTDNKGYFLRLGDNVYDGTVIAVDSRRGSVTFRQQVDDPRLIKPYRDVVKRLEPLEESADE